MLNYDLISEDYFLYNEEMKLVKSARVEMKCSKFKGV